MLLASLLVAAAATTQDAKVPQFGVGVDLIRLDVSVVDGRGRPARGLDRSDFRVTEDGRPVDVSFFEAVDQVGPVEDEESGDDEETPARPPRRRVVVLVDTSDMSPAQLHRAREGTAEYLRRATSEGDWVRLLNLSTARFWDGHIPEDRERLASAALRLGRQASPWDRGDDVAAIQDRSEARRSGTTSLPFSSAESSGRTLSMFARTAGLLGTLESLLVELDGVKGRKALVLVSTGFPQLRDLDARLERVATLARRSATAVYFVDAAGLDGLSPEENGGRMRSVFELAWDRSGGAQDLAEFTGGFASRFSARLSDALSRVASELRTYYVVGYVPERPDDGKFHSVKVRLNRSGLVARTKRGYLAIAR